MCSGTPVQNYYAVRLRWHGNEWPGQGGECGGECVRVHSYTMMIQAG